jgi:hypothetical protein
MIPYFDVDDLDVDKLLRDWRWLCPQAVTLVAVDAFGDLFLENQNGSVMRLDVSAGEVASVAESRALFVKSAANAENQKAWFCSDAEMRLEKAGLGIGSRQCYAFKTPLVFREASNRIENVYVADLYECVSFLGNLHLQLRDCPDGSKVRLRIDSRQ